MISATQSEQRLEALYEISTLLAHVENEAQPFDPALGVVARTLPLRSAILIETDETRSTMIVWPCEGQDAEHMSAVKENVRAAYAYLTGARSPESLTLSEQAGLTKLPRPVPFEANPASKLIIIPLVVASRPPFGALQMEGAGILDEADLRFVSTIANHLAVALDRDRARRRDMARRQDAEEGQTRAETTRATAEGERVVAQTSRDKYEVLAAENAKLYERERRAVHAREHVLAVVSHDLRNPLAAIVVTADSLAKRDVAEERRRGLPKAVARIQRAAQRMQRLVEDLLDFSSLEAGKLALDRKETDAESMIHETLVSFDKVVPDQGLSFATDIEPNLPSAYCDRDRIVQVLSNLVGNATKAVAAGGHVTVRLRRQGDELLFSVIDDGRGIKEHELKHLFERYWRSDEAQYKGTGLGLAIAGGIIAAHGGRIWAESELGRGATFLFTVPTRNELEAPVSGAT